MLDDASKEGVEEALSLLPVSSEGSGLLVTSHLIKAEKRESKTEEGLVTTHVIKVEDVFRGLLAARAILYIFLSVKICNICVLCALVTQCHTLLV
jgi:hypothetical protein